MSKPLSVLMLCATLSLVSFPSPAAAAKTSVVEVVRHFDVPSGSAIKALQMFSKQAEVQVLFPTDLVEGLRTRAVRGRLTPKEALEEMVAGTGLAVVYDEETGALGIRKSRESQASQTPIPQRSEERVAREPSLSPPTNEPPQKSMKRRNPLALLLLGLFALTSSPAPEARAETVSEMVPVSGRVYNEATGAYLEGAQVRVQGTDLQTSTDREGRYTLAVPTGPVVLVVSYAGLDTQYLTVSLNLGQPATRDVGLTSGVYKLESFVVEGDREGGALVAARQRGIFNATNIAATDAFGTQTDDNVGSFLQRLPGLTAEFSGQDVREVQVRGIAADLNTVSMDGVQMANTNSSGTNRFFDFLQASISMIESIEVTKAPTPDMPANSIGGNINLVTRSIFSRRNPRTFTYSLGMVHALNRIGGRAESSKRWYEEPIDDFTPVVRLGYTDVIGKNRNIGFSLNYSRQTAFAGSKLAANYYQGTLNRPAYLYRSSMYVSSVSGPNTRQNINGKLEFKLSDNTLLTLTAAHNFFLEIVDTRTHNFQTGNSAARIAPGYSEVYSEVLPHTQSVSSVSHAARDNSSHNYRLGTSVEHRLGDMVIDYSATLSLSAGHQDFAPFERKYKKGVPKAALSITGLNNIGFIIDRRDDPSWARITQTSGPDAYDLNSYTSMVMNQDHRIANASIREGRVNVRRQFALAVPAYMKAGVQYQEQRRDRDYNYHRYTFTGPGGLGQFAEDDSWARTLVDNGRRQGPWVDTLYVAQYKEDNPQYWSEDLSYKYVQRLQNLMDFREKVTSLYWMGHVQLQNLGVLGGLRVEETKTEGNGPLYQLTAEERALRAAWVGPLTPDEIRRRAYAEWGERTQSRGEYRKVFPGIHFKYDHPSGVVARASYTTSIGRPALTSIIPNRNVNDDNQTVSASNTGLRPQFADNFDLSLEYYLKPVGLISASVFLKEVTDFIYSDSSQIIGEGPNNGFDGLYEGYRLTTSSNGGSARYRGFELSYQQQLRFLPHPLKGIGINANYTQIETEGDYGGAVATTQVAGFRPKSANLSVNYKLNRFELRVQSNWVDDYLITVSTNAALLRYQSDRITTNAKMSYALNSQTTLYVNWDNVFNVPVVRDYYYYSDRNFQTRSAWPTIAFGVQGRF